MIFTSNNGVAKIAVIFFLLFTSNAKSLQLLMGVDPVNDPNVMAKEVAPLLEAMNHKYGLEYIPSSSTQELIQQVKGGNINCAYVSLGYAYLLQKMGFVLLLESDEKVKFDLIGKAGLDFDKGENYKSEKVYYVKNDLFMKYMIHEANEKYSWVANPIPAMTSENIMMKILKEESSLGYIIGDGLQLLHRSLRDNLKVYQSEEIGSVYFLVNKDFLSISNDIRKDFLSFHEGFKDPDERYNYLRVYHFKKVKNDKLHVNENYAHYLENYL